MEDSKTLKNIEKRLTALVALMTISIFESRDEIANIKPEVVLSKVGLENSDIAALLGKQLTAVQKTIQRSKKK